MRGRVNRAPGPYFVFLKERATHIAIEGISEVSFQQSQSGLQYIRLLSIVNGVHKEIHKPAACNMHVHVMHM